MKQTVTRSLSLWLTTLLTLPLLIALGCSGEDRDQAASTLEQAGEKMGDAVDSAGENLGDAAGRASDAASAAATDAAQAAGAAVDSATAAAGDAATAARDAIASPVKDCVALAAKSAWGEALEPCKLAAEERPDDLQIRHALQQAEAAAADSAVN